MSPAKRRRAMIHIRQHFPRLSERRACRVLGQPRTTQRRVWLIPDDEAPLVRRMIELATQYGRYGYRIVTGMLRNEGWQVNHKRVERLWRQEGLKVPQRQRPRRRLWLNDGSCVRLRPQHRNHVWSYDFVQARTSEGRPLRMLTVLDEYTRECLAIEVERKLTAEDVLVQLTDLFVRRGVPKHLRSDNGSEFTAEALYIEPGSPWENGYIESFNGRLRAEFLNGEVFDTLLEAKVLIERWRKEYNTIRPHSSLGYRPPAPTAIQPAGSGATPLCLPVDEEGSKELT